MRVFVNTPAGNIGRVVVSELIQRGHEVAILSRHPETIQHFVQNGATHIFGSMDDVRVVEKGMEGANAVFWLTPVVFDQSDYVGLG